MMNKIFGLLLLSGVIGTAAYSDLPQQKQSESPIRYTETETVYAPLSLPEPPHGFKPLDDKPDFAFPAQGKSPVYETESMTDDVTISTQTPGACSGGACRPSRGNRIFRRK